jgi:type IV secretory pathway VirB2 component (pilin)
MFSNLSFMKYNSDFYWKLFVFFCFVSMTLFSTNETLAAAVAGDANDTFGNALCNVVGTLKGNTARAIATTAIFVLGLGFIGGKLQWQTVAIASIGIVTIFSAETLITFLSGSTSGAAACVVT